MQPSLLVLERSGLSVQRAHEANVVHHLLGNPLVEKPTHGILGLLALLGRQILILDGVAQPDDCTAHLVERQHQLRFQGGVPGPAGAGLAAGALGAAGEDGADSSSEE